MNAAIIILFGIIWFIFAYFWWGNVIKNKVLQSNDNNEVPSIKYKDNKDYVPTNPVILFGHHFSSIAGAGPIVGPILAFAWFGWLPALIWILVGSVFMGAVHDYTSLLISVRNRGISIVEITENAISKKARTIFAIFVWLTLVLVQAIFADLTARTLTEKPEIALPTISVIFIAIIFGWAVYRKGLNLFIATISALSLLILSIYLGNQFPIIASYDIWLILTFAYTMIAAILPVWVLLQPRDYISVYILLIGMAIGMIGVLVLQPEINAPAYLGFSSNKGPLFPILFITVACGAISGFHSLVSSGTSAKQLRKESDGKKVAFGGMLTEGALAMLVIAMVSSVLIWNPNPAEGEFIFQNLLQKSANIVFGTALGLSVQSIGIPLSIGIQFGVLMLNAFILTTLDTSARLNRYILQETTGGKLGGIFKNRYVATFLSLLAAYLLIALGGYKILWPLFGASNQLIATLALFVISTYLFGIKAPKLYTLIPAIFMLFVTEIALFYQIFWEFAPNNNWILLTIASILFILGLMIVYESIKKMIAINKANQYKSEVIEREKIPTPV